MDHDNSIPRMQARYSEQEETLIQEPETPKPSYTRPKNKFHSKNSNSPSKFLEKNKKQLENKQKSLIEKRIQKHEKAKAELELKKKRELKKQKKIQKLYQERVKVENEFELAAITIQRYSRGYLVRKFLKESLREVFLDQHVEIFEENIWLSLGETGHKAATTIQKNLRGFLARKELSPTPKDLVNQKIHSAKVIQKHIRKFLAQKTYQKKLQEKAKFEKLEVIKERLKSIRVNNFLLKKKFVWKTIRKKHGLEDNSPQEKFIQAQNEESFEELNKENNATQLPQTNNFKEKLTIKTSEPSWTKQSIKLTAETPTGKIIPPRTPNWKSTKPVLAKESSLNFQSSKSGGFNRPKTKPEHPKPSEYSKPEHPKPPINPSSNFLKPTQTYLIKYQEPEYPQPKRLRTSKNKKIRPLTRPYQKNTKSREKYINELLSNSRAASANTKLRKPELLLDNLKNECNLPPIKTKDSKKTSPKSLVNKTEPKLNIPQIYEPENSSNYEPPSMLSYDFKTALPEMFNFVREYGQNIQSEKRTERPQLKKVFREIKFSLLNNN